MPLITYQTINKRPLQINIIGDYKTAKATLVYFHGGFWDKSNIHLIDMEWALEYEIAVAMVEYSFNNEAKIPRQFHDAHDSLRFLSDKAQSIVLGGHSSGGLIAASCLYAEDIRERVSGLLLVASELDLIKEYRDIGDQWNWFPSITGKVNPQEIEKTLADYSPMNNIDQFLDVPIQAHHGVLDDLPASNSKSFINACVQSGNLDAEYYDYHIGHNVEDFNADESFRKHVLNLFNRI